MALTTQVCILKRYEIDTSNLELNENPITPIMDDFVKNEIRKFIQLQKEGWVVKDYFFVNRKNNQPHTLLYDFMAILEKDI